MSQETSQEKGAILRRPRPVRAPPVVPDHELLRCIGRGAYGEVWLGRNVMGTLRAVKAVYSEDFETESAYRRELDGVRKFEPISRTHEGLIDVLQIGHNETEGYFYYVMELADCAEDEKEKGRKGGEENYTSTTAPSHSFSPAHYSPRTLRSDIQQRGRIPAHECLKLAVALTQALEHLHQHGLIHRDIKPSNIIFVHGVAKLADIGLVTDSHDAKSLVGTEGYIPPEGPGSAQADIYSLGHVLYEISTGKDRARFPEPPTALVEFPDRLDVLELQEVIQKACEKDARHRYADASAMLKELALLQGGESLQRLRKTERRLARIKKFGIAAGLVFTLAVAAFLFQREQTRQFKRLAQESRDRLVRLNVANGVRSMDEGDFMTSLVWFVEALKLTQGDLVEEDIHRRRIEAVLRQCPRLAQLGTHRAAINMAAFSPDERHVLTASDDHTAGLWELTSGERLRSFEHGGSVKHAGFSPDGKRIVTASEDGTACVWDVATGERLLPPLRHERGVVVAAFSPDGTLIVTASNDRTARLWDSYTGKAISPPLAHRGVLNHAEFSRDGRWLSTASDDSTACIWDAHSGQPAFAPLAHPDHVRYASFSPDSLRVVTACRDGKIRVWSMRDGKQLEPVMTQEGPVQQVLFSANGHRILSCGGIFGMSGEARVWDAETGAALTPSLRHGAPVRRVAWSSDGLRIFTASNDRTVRLWNARSGDPVGPLLRHNHSAWFATFSSDNKRLLTASRDGIWRLWKLPADSESTLVLHHEAFIQNAGFSPDGQQVVTASEDGTARLWDANTGQIRSILRGHSGYVWYAAFSPDGHQVVTTSSDRTARIWDTVSFGPVCPPLEHKDVIRCAAFTLDGKRVITVSDDETARIWDVKSGQPLCEPLRHQGKVRFLTVSPDGRYVITCAGDAAMPGRGEARIWSALNGEAATPAMKHATAVNGAAFSPDSRRVVISCGDDSVEPQVVRIWDVQTGQPVGPTLPHSDGVSTVAFSPDGRRIATGTEDGIARIWNAVTGEPLTRLLRHYGRGVESVSFSADGRQLITSSHDHTARVWDTLTGEPITPSLRHGGILSIALFSPTATTVLTAGTDRTDAKEGVARIWRLPTNTQPVEELEMLAQLLAGSSIDSTGGLTPLSPEKLHNLFLGLHGRETKR